MKKIFKQNNGITLIALIITIIVMLILVAVTISMAVNGGLFGYAGNAAKQTEEAKQKELDWLNVDGMTTDQLIAKFTTDREKDLEFLNKVFTIKLKEFNNETLTEEEIAKLEAFDEEERKGELKTIDELSTEEYQIIYYHGNYYKSIAEYTDGNLTGISTEPYELTEEDLATAAATIAINSGDGIPLINEVLYEYNNNIYDMTSGGAVLVGAKNEIAIVYNDNGDYIIIRPTAGQTWVNWASTSQEDLTVYDTTLKQIISNNGSGNYGIVDPVASGPYTRFIENYNTAILTGYIYSVGSNR